MPNAAPRILTERSALSALLGEWQARRVLLLTTPSRRFVHTITAILGGAEVTVFSGAKVHVPRPTVDAGLAAFDRIEPDVIVSLGGGAATGLGKAVRLERDARFVAIPTTFSGSESTDIYGIREGETKTTGSDPRVRPDAVLHDSTLLAFMPLGTAVQSLLNSLAHPISALSTDSLDANDRARALRLVDALVTRIEELVQNPTSGDVRRAALADAGRAASILMTGTMGTQHTVAHRLGGRFGVAHAALHSIVLPQFLRWLRETRPELATELDRATGRLDLEGELYDLLRRVDAPTRLRDLHIEWSAFDAWMEGQRDLPTRVLLGAYFGVRPHARAVRVDSPDGPSSLHWGPPLATARRVVVALHGRGSDSGRALAQAVSLAGSAPDIAVLSLQADANHWYPERYSAPLDERSDALESSIDRVERCLRSLPGEVSLFGISQGACLAVEAAARSERRLAGIVAPAGARNGPPAQWRPASPTLSDVPVLLGVGEDDAWVSVADVRATADNLRAAGARVEVVTEPGDRHEPPARLRIRARAILSGRTTATVRCGLSGTAEVEQLAEALPKRQNSPRRPPHGLYAEQINATGFVAPRAKNLRTWCYRVRPSGSHRLLESASHPTFHATFVDVPPAINLMGWRPPQTNLDDPRDFVDGLFTLGGAGAPALRRGYAVHWYTANRSMEQRSLSNADGDLLVLPVRGGLTILTELGVLEAAPGTVAILRRGMHFSVLLDEGSSMGYVGEAFGRPFELPERGPIGANSLVDERHIRGPMPWFEDALAPGFEQMTKLGGRLHRTTRDHSPFDVVAWHGNWVSCTYDLMDFSPVANVRFDHGDPSVYTVLSAPMDETGAHTMDLVAFVPRWDPTEKTFRPPFFHRNVTTELNGIIMTPGTGTPPFEPGAFYITPPLTPHAVRAGSVRRTYEQSDADADTPARLADGSIWIQFETALPFSPTPQAVARAVADAEWRAMWGVHPSRLQP